MSVMPVSSPYLIAHKQAEMIPAKLTKQAALSPYFYPPTMQHQASHDLPVSLESKVAFLRLTESYPTAGSRIEAIETHMSWVFLTDTDAYKLKKPVQLDELDCRSLESRHYYCQQELHLNRRLAPDVYLGLVPLCLDANGHLHLGGPGPVVDWLVRMRRLSPEAMLDAAIKNSRVSATDIERIACCLRDFYRRCVCPPVDPATFCSHLYEQIAHNQRALTTPHYGLLTIPVTMLCQWQSSWIANQQAVFAARINKGHLVEGHGDLRPEHICLQEPVAIIDCLEFSPRLRQVDCIDEVAFLALECEKLGAPDLGTLLLQRYTVLADDWPDPALVHFYQSYRAAIRARIAIRHLDEEKFRFSPEWRQRAMHYLQLAIDHQTNANEIAH